MFCCLFYSCVCRENEKSQFDPVDLCKLLVKSMKAADLNITDTAGCTPLHYAARRGSSICCVYLIQVTFPLANQRIHTHTHARTHARMHARTHARAHTHTHTHTHTPLILSAFCKCLQLIRDGAPEISSIINIIIVCY